MKCCNKCFNDNFLSNQIILEATGQTEETCSLCGNENASFIEANTLADLTMQVLDLYIASDANDSKPIWEWLKQDWLLLKNLSNESCSLLLRNIFPDEQLDEKRFIPKTKDKSRLELWEEFKNELRHENRFFPEKLPVLKELNHLFDFLLHKVDGTDFYRSRISDGEIYPLEEMGKPPIGKTKNGRANPVGISYLYTGSSIDTAVAEVRPQIGDSVCIATFKPKETLHLLDLRNPREKVSPFEIQEENLPNLRLDLDYLCRLGEELSKPIKSSRVHLDYLASQYLCEYIKKLGKYDGVIYKSSVSSGYNVAFFSENKLEINNDINLRKVDSITYIHSI